MSEQMDLKQAATLKTRLRSLSEGLRDLWRRHSLRAPRGLSDGGRGGRVQPRAAGPRLR